MAVLARRFAPARCVVLDDGVRVPLRPDGQLPPTPACSTTTATSSRQVRHDAPPGARPPTRRLAINRLRERSRSTPPPSTASWRGTRCRSSRARAARSCSAARPTRCSWPSGSSACPTRCPLRRLRGTDLWYLVLELPEGSRVELPARDQPRRPRTSGSTTRSTRSCPTARSARPRSASATATSRPSGRCPTRTPRPGELVELTVRSRALRPRLPGDALPAGTVPAHRRVPAAGRARRPRLPAVRRRRRPCSTT